MSTFDHRIYLYIICRYILLTFYTYIHNTLQMTNRAPSNETDELLI